jgi:hypothetical protein
MAKAGFFAIRFWMIFFEKPTFMLRISNMVFIAFNRDYVIFAYESLFLNLV